MVLIIKELSSVSLKPRTFNEFIDYTWDEIEGTFVKENILGSGTQPNNMEVSIDYILFLKFTRKIFTYAKNNGYFEKWIGITCNSY
jgi:hypothetical protein